MSRAHLFLFDEAPLRNVHALELLDAALVAAAFDLPTTLLFLGDGVLQLLPEVSPNLSQEKAMARQLAVLPEYGIEQVYACGRALDERQLAAASLVLSVIRLDPAEQTALFARQDVIIGS
ncbi:MAG: sulfurtransferase complex subunit TusC [Pseudomonadota bacterium]